MKNRPDKYYLIIIAVLFAIIVLNRACSPTFDVPKSTTKTTIDTIFNDTKDSIVYVPIPSAKIAPKIRYIKEKVKTSADTIAIIKDYFSKISYTDTIKIDTFGFVLIKDTISENKLKYRKVVRNYSIPTITKTTINTVTPPKKYQFYGGLDIVGNKKEPINYFGPSLSVLNKKDHLYNIGVGLSSNGEIGYRLSTQWRIKLHNPK